jgi:3-oxoadipate enol-lactonase
MAFWKAEDDTLINYEVVGNDPKRETLLLLPSMLGAITTEWRNFERTLAADYRLIHMDLRGHGRSENKAPDLKPDRMAQDIVGLLDHLQVQRAHIAGYSLGGYLGLMVALGQPRRVPPSCSTAPSARTRSGPICPRRCSSRSSARS